MLLKLNEDIIFTIQKNLLVWFANSGRTFPWRETQDPYAILLAEKLLQQTSVRQSLVDIYLHLIRDYPTIQYLSHADVEDIRNVILPLGLHYRASELIQMAREIEERFGGNIPNTLQALLAIYGIGEYSARAVLCFAYGQDVPIVDTNIARIFFRVFGIQGPMPANPARKKSLIELAGILLPKGKSKEFNWALIDHGALICKPKKPLCESCPLNQFCTYYQEELENRRFR